MNKRFIIGMCLPSTVVVDDDLIILSDDEFLILAERIEQQLAFHLQTDRFAQ